MGINKSFSAQQVQNEKPQIEEIWTQNLKLKPEYLYCPYFQYLQVVQMNYTT
jgi:hypothetical protein